MDNRSQNTTYDLCVGVEQADDNKPSDQKSDECNAPLSVSVSIIKHTTETLF